MSKTQTKKLAKFILASTTKNGKIDTLSFSRILAILKKDGSFPAIAVLNILEKLIDRQEKNRQIIVESAFPLERSTNEVIKTRYEKLLGKNLDLIEKENKDLIGGIRISNADFVWENSVMSNLTQLKGALTNE